MITFHRLIPIFFVSWHITKWCPFVYTSLWQSKQRFSVEMFCTICYLEGTWWYIVYNHFSNNSIAMVIQTIVQLDTICKKGCNYNFTIIHGVLCSFFLSSDYIMVLASLPVYTPWHFICLGEVGEWQRGCARWEWGMGTDGEGVQDSRWSLQHI